MTDILLATFAGVIIGAIFTLIKLPSPDPLVLSGCMAIFGVWAGNHLVLQAMEHFQSKRRNR